MCLGAVGVLHTILGRAMDRGKRWRVGLVSIKIVDAYRYMR